MHTHRVQLLLVLLDEVCCVVRQGHLLLSKLVQLLLLALEQRHQLLVLLGFEGVRLREEGEGKGAETAEGQRKTRAQEESGWEWEGVRECAGGGVVGCGRGEGGVCLLRAGSIKHDEVMLCNWWRYS
jgi:hypothetical protein